MSGRIRKYFNWYTNCIFKNYLLQNHAPQIINAIERMLTGKYLKSLIDLSLIFLISTLLFSGCIDRISTNTEQGGNQLVIEGKITNGNGPFSVIIGRTSTNEQVMEPVSGAHVMIVDETDHKRETYTEGEKGTYNLDGKVVSGQKGHVYHIEVTLQNGSVYRSNPEIMPEAVTQDSAYFKVGIRTTFNQYGIPIKDHVVRVYVNTRIPQTTSPIYLRWYIDEIYVFKEYYSGAPLAPPPHYCFVTAYPNPQNIVLYNGEGMHKNEINNQLMATRVVDYSFFFRHFFNVHVVSLTRNAYIYWKHVNKAINSNGTIFDVPPATVAGNIYNVNDSKEVVLGYFEAAAVDTARCDTYRSDFSYPVDEPCPTFDERLGCQSCLRINNSTLTQPYYFK